MKLIAGIDDTGTEAQVSEGWSYFIIPAADRVTFDSEVTPIAQQLKKKFFHAKKFKDREKQQYEDFLKIISGSILSASYAAGGSILNSIEWKTNLRMFLTKITTNALLNNEISDPSLVETIVSFVEPICTLTSLINRPADELIVEIDTDLIKSNLDILHHEVGKSKITATRLLISICNKYCQTQFSGSPRVIDIKAVKDSKSTIVQAADVIGNFQMAHIFNKLGDTSARRKIKSSIFEDVFRGSFEAFDFSAVLRLLTKNKNSPVATDLELIGHARLKLLIESVVG